MNLLTDSRYEVYQAGRAPQYFRRAAVAEVIAKDAALKDRATVYMFDRFAQPGEPERWKFVPTSDPVERCIKFLIGFKES